MTGALPCFLYPFVDLQALIPFTFEFQEVLVFAVGTVILACLLFPYFYRLVFGWYSREKLGVKGESEFTMSALARLLGLHGVALLVYILAYYYCFKAYIPDQIFFNSNFSFIVLLATFSGFLAIFAPAGLGVRESVLYLAFSQSLNSPLLVMICLAPRLILLMSELVFYIIARIYVGGIAKSN